MQQQEELAEAVQQIQDFRLQLGETLANSPNFKMRADNALERLQNAFAHVVGGNIPQAQMQTEPAGPLKTFMGQPLPETPVPAKLEEPTRSEMDLVIEEVDKAYIAFPILEASEIREHYSDLVIRGVAKRAGMKVTATEPAKLTNAFLESIKVAIAAKADHDAQVAEAEATSEEIKARAKSPAAQEMQQTAADVVTEPEFVVEPEDRSETEVIAAPQPTQQAEAVPEETKAKAKGPAGKK